VERLGESGGSSIVQIAEAGKGGGNTNPKWMKHLFVVSLLIWGAVAAPASGASSGASDAPRAVLAADANGRSVSQKGKVIVSTWNGTDYDISFPPLKWPRSMKASGEGQLTLSIHTSELPNGLEIRMWKRIRSNGIPKGQPRFVECYTDRVLPGECTLQPTVTSAGIGWKTAVDAPWDGHVYIATLANWSDAQVVWINHLMLN
jgi:hypothetical protein